MAAKLGGGGKRGIVDINITPFVDIVLVVLIIFMVTSSVVASEHIPVDLPDAATGTSDTSVSLAIMIQADGELSLDGQPINTDRLRQSIRTARAEGEVTCLIGADTATSHGDVVAVIDLVRQEGVSRFALDVDPAPLPPAAPGGAP